MGFAHAMDRPDLKDVAERIKRSVTDPRKVKAALGLGATLKDREGPNVRCPVHGGKSLSVFRAKGGVGAKCHGPCDFSGDVLSLVAAVAGLDIKRDFAEVVIAAAEYFNLNHLAEEARQATARRGDVPRARPALRVVPPPPVLEHEERTYPPADEVNALWGTGGAVADDDEARAMLEGRKLDPYAIDYRRLAKVIPKGAILPSWARYQGRSWTATGHRIIVPVFDAQGIMRSVRAWRAVDGDTPKRLPPAGHKAAGIVLADEGARAILEGHQAAPLPVVIAEGEADFLTWALLVTAEKTWATFGVLSGAWSQEIADRIPNASVVNVWTDRDEAGDKYARTIAQTLAHRCKVIRK